MRIALWLLLTVLAGCAGTPAIPARPNVLVILVDDLGWRDLGPYGQDFASTPNIDALAREGVVFTAAYSANPVCSPTRASLMTGKYPARVNINDWIPGTEFPNARTLPPRDLDALPLEEWTLAEALRGAGYSTMHVGKWHLGGTGLLPRDQGFDVNIMGGHIGHPASHFFPYGNAWEGKPAASHAVPLPSLSGGPGEYLADRQAQEACALLRAASAQKEPFFMHLSFYAVHTPLEAKRTDIEHYRSLKAERGLGGAALPRPVYAAMIQELDTAVGRVLEELRADGLDGSTMVVLTSDNGGLSSSTDNGPLRGGKRSLWEGGIRVPLVIRWPGVAAPNSRQATPVITQDLFATVCEAAGAPVSAECKEDSRSLLGLLSGRDPGLNREALCWHFPQNETATVGPRGAIREGRWKLIEEYEDGSTLLFDLSADPSETTDLAAASPETAQRLVQKLRAWRASVGAQMPTPNPRAAGGVGP